MSDREAVFANIRKALQPLKDKQSERPRASLPDWEDNLIICRSHPDAPDNWQLFAKMLKAVNGTPINGLTALIAWLYDNHATHGYCDPTFTSILKATDTERRLTLETQFDSNRYDDYAFGITRASIAIAESGTLVFKDGQTSSRLAALAPWIHVALITRADIVYSIPEAIKRHGDDPNIIWATGPSKTADVEGILIEGVHGPGIQIACLID